MAYGGRVVHGKGCGPWGWVRRVSLFSSSVSLSHHLISASVFLAVKWGWQSPLEVFLNNMSQSTETSPQKILNVSLMLSKSKTIHCRLRWKKNWFKIKVKKKKKRHFPLAEANQKTKRKKQVRQSVVRGESLGAESRMEAGKLKSRWGKTKQGTAMQNTCIGTLAENNIWFGHDVVQSLSCVQLFATPRTAAHQASLSFTISLM